jgi:hypothetical protein
MADQPQAKRAWRFLRWGLVSTAVLATFLAALITEEDWRGEHDWENYKYAAEMGGDQFDWASFMPTNVPDDQNFAKAPIFAGLTSMKWDAATEEWQPGNSNIVDRLKMRLTREDGPLPRIANADWSRGQLTDLPGWQAYYRLPDTNVPAEFPVAAQAQSPGADVLLALSKYDSAIEELRDASRRPFAYFGPYRFYDPTSNSFLLIYLQRSKACCTVIELRAVAELAENQGDRALDDVELLLRLGDELRNERLLIAQLVSVAETRLALQPIYEGLAGHRWNDSQLAELEDALAKKDFLADFKIAMRGERNCAIDAFETQRLTRQIQTVVEENGSNKVDTISLRWMPAAYFYQNQLAFARMFDQFILPLADLNHKTVSVAASLADQGVLLKRQKRFSPYSIQALMTLPSVIKSVTKFAVAQTDVDLARTACALERYRLVHGEYPESLEVLAPQWMASVPHDVINGQPLHYRRTEDGKFVLYSVGWNDQDDGGMIAYTKDGRLDPENGDWVWKY